MIFCNFGAVKKNAKIVIKNLFEAHVLSQGRFDSLTSVHNHLNFPDERPGSHCSLIFVYFSVTAGIGFQWILRCYLTGSYLFDVMPSTQGFIKDELAGRG
jgi:hypothetical protein